jgi:hypothetical protein
MTKIVRGLDENTLPQRKGSEGQWALADGDDFERRDTPPRAVAWGLAGTLLGLVLSVGAALWVANALRPRASLQAFEARMQFQAPGPALETRPPSARLALQRAHPAPSGPALDAAIAAVTARGWGDQAPPPSRAETALKRAVQAQ